MGEPIPGMGEPSTKFKADKPAVEQKEKKEMKKLGTEELLERLQNAFGGESAPSEVVGQAIVGQIRKGELANSSVEDCIMFIDEMAQLLADKAEEQEKVSGRKNYRKIHGFRYTLAQGIVNNVREFSNLKTFDNIEWNTQDKKIFDIYLILRDKGYNEVSYTHLDSPKKDE